MAVCCAACGASTGCLAGDESELKPVIDSLELENYRREAGHECTVQIEDEREIVFDETHRPGSAGSGNDATVVEDPVEPGAYTVRVTVDEYSATTDTQTLVEDEKPWLRLKFYLIPETLYVERRSYDRCE